MAPRILAAALILFAASCAGPSEPPVEAKKADPPAAAPAPPPTPAAPSLHDVFDGAQAFAYTKQVAGFGERSPGSEPHKKTQALIKEVVQKNGGAVETDDFTASTPR